MKYCKMCGAELTENAKFCSECGTKIETEISAPAQENNNEGVKEPFYKKIRFSAIKQFLPYVLAVLSVVIVIILAASSSQLTKNEKMFVDVYKQFVESTLENPESIEITSVTEYTDENGGVVVNFHYKYKTDVGYTKTDNLYVVTSRITIDASLIEFGMFGSSYYEGLVEKYNGCRVKRGFTTQNTSTLTSSSEEIQILSLWMSLQAKSDWDAYDVDAINKAIH